MMPSYACLSISSARSSSLKPYPLYSMSLFFSFTLSLLLTSFERSHLKTEESGYLSLLSIFINRFILYTRDLLIIFVDLN